MARSPKRTASLTGQCALLSAADRAVPRKPGLRNGAMAHWNTTFVEVPLEVFDP